MRVLLVSFITVCLCFWWAMEASATVEPVGARVAPNGDVIVEWTDDGSELVNYALWRARADDFNQASVITAALASSTDDISPTVSHLSFSDVNPCASICFYWLERQTSPSTFHRRLPLLRQVYLPMIQIGISSARGG
jgi:hypothetical protein